MAKRRRMVDTSVPENKEDAPLSRSKQRTARRGEQNRLEALGKRLTELTDRALESLELGDALERELQMLASLSSGSALSRQRRRVAGLLRELDLDALEQRVELAAGATATHASAFRLERMRRDLVRGDDVVLGRIFDEHPGVDRQRVHQAVRAARREAEKGAAGRRFKELYQLLKELGLGDVPPPE